MELREFYHLKRRSLGITIQEIADKLKVNQSTVSRWETGKIPIAKEYIDYIDSKESEIKSTKNTYWKNKGE